MYPDGELARKKNYPSWNQIHTTPSWEVVANMPEDAVMLQETREKLIHRHDALRVMAVIGLLAKGFSPQAIVKRLPGVPTQYIMNLQKFDWVQAELDARVKALVKSPLEAFAPRLPAALEVYDKALSGDNPKVALTAAVDIADRLYGKPKTTEQGGERNPNITIIFGDYKPEQVVEGEVVYGEKPSE